MGALHRTGRPLGPKLAVALLLAGLTGFAVFAVRGSPAAAQEQAQPGTPQPAPPAEKPPEAQPAAPAAEAPAAPTPQPAPPADATPAPAAPPQNPQPAAAQPDAATAPSAQPAPADAPAPAAEQPADAQQAEAPAQGFTLRGILYDDSSLFIFFLVTIVMGGAAGYSSGKAIAQTWRPGWHLVASALALGIAVRFIHFALFDASFLTPHYYIIDTLLVLAATFAGFRLTRVRQMTTRYRWLYSATGPFGWKTADPSGASSE